jgi:hypothetical protein
VLILAGCLLPGSASAQAFVQAAAGSPGTAARTFSLSFPANTTAGNLIMVGFDFNSTVTVTSVSDTQGNVFTPVGNQLTTPGGAAGRVYYANNIKGGVDTITVAVSANSTYLEVYGAEYAGVDRVTPIDAQAGSSGSTSSVSSGAAATSAAGSIIYGFCIGDSACTPGPGFTARSTFQSNLVEDMIAGGPGPYAAIGSANSGWTMQMVALKAAAPSGGPTSPLNACDVATPFGVIDASDVQATINMALGLSPCTANVVGPNTCNVVVVQRVVNASLGGPCLTPTSTHSVTLSWTASSSANVTGYKVYRGAVSGGPYALVSSIGAATTFVDSSVQSGQTYFYVVTAVDSNNNESAYSGQASASVPVS